MRQPIDPPVGLGEGEGNLAEMRPKGNISSKTGLSLPHTSMKRICSINITEINNIF